MMKESLVVSWISSLTSVLDEFNKIDLRKVVETPIYSRNLKSLAELLNRTYEEVDQLLLAKEHQLRDELLFYFENKGLDLTMRRECSFCYGIYFETTKIARVFLNDGQYEVFPLTLKETYNQTSIKEQEGILVVNEGELETKEILVSIEPELTSIEDVEAKYLDRLTQLNEEVKMLTNKKTEVSQMQWKNQWRQLNRESIKAMTRKEDVLKGYEATIENLKLEIRAHQAILHRISGLKAQTLSGELSTEMLMKKQLKQLFEEILNFSNRICS